MHADKRWVTTPSGDMDRVATISHAHNISPILANLLLQRGIDTPQAAAEFFAPELSNLHDPFLMRDMMIAVKRLDQAVTNGEGIMVYGDYDVDGTTAVSLVYLFLRDFVPEDKLFFYIPDRYVEGYGISERGIDYAADNSVKLIITLDCGIKAIKKVAYAKSKGIDFIICDHHLPDEELPAAVAVLDPKRVNCDYPFKELSGCGVGFKMLQAYCLYKELPFSRIEGLLDLVAVSIASDIVPIVGENRILAYYGLKKLNQDPNQGLSAIIEICYGDDRFGKRLRQQLQIDDIIFKIGPRINAAGRMDIGTDLDNTDARSGGRNAVKLLTAQTVEKALHYVNKIDAFNQDRKNIDRDITLQAHKFIEEDPTHEAKKCTVIYNPDWMKGVVGIVASRLIETYYRPTVVLTMSNGLITGSARSIPGFDLYQAIEHCSDLLENFGGHTYAAGLTMKPENLDAFRKKFEEFVDKTIDPDTLIQQITIDTEVNFSDITPKFRDDLARFAPFGPGNLAPTFVSLKVADNGNARKVGAHSSHLKMDLGQVDKQGNIYTSISAIAFGQIELYDHIKLGHSIDVCYNLVENYYHGVVTPQLRVRDMRPTHE